MNRQDLGAQNGIPICLAEALQILWPLTVASTRVRRPRDEATAYLHDLSRRSRRTLLSASSRG
jgi:hypothetical protein